MPQAESKNQDFKDVQNSRRIENFDERQNAKWISFAKSRTTLGFEHLTTNFPTMTSDKIGLSLCFEEVEGWSIPSSVLKEFGEGNYEINVQLSFSLFHLGSGSFFGSTWMGPSIPLGGGSKEKKKINFKYNDIVYLITRINDPSCVAVVEVVVSKFDDKRNITLAQYG